VGFADAQYDAAVADLERALKSGRGKLDASTIAALEQSLQAIDQAIDQARQALAADPANSYLSGHLVETRRRKLDLLRRATALTESN
jgi:tetratricopeptide (TPR) repeat protein